MKNGLYDNTPCTPCDEAGPVKTPKVDDVSPSDAKRGYTDSGGNSMKETYTGFPDELRRSRVQGVNK